MPLNYVRAVASDPDVLRRYYDLLYKTLCENDILDNPQCIFNLDETGLALNPKPQKVVVAKGTKCATHITGDNRTNITVLVCANAAGLVLPPLILFDRKTLSPQMTHGEVPGSAYGLSGSSWMTQDIFLEWFTTYFLEHAPRRRPLLLLLDGHASHYYPEMIKKAAESQVVLFTLPPHTTHLIQPLDRSVFSSLKSNWKHVCHNFLVKNPGQVITRYDFSALLYEAWSKSMTMRNVCAGFRVTGICPFNRDAANDLLPTEVGATCNSPARVSNLPFVPIYSPFSQKPDDSSKCLLVQKKDTRSLSAFLKTPTAPYKKSTKNVKSCGKVLTSYENLEFIKMKEEEKAHKMRLMNERKQIRQEKKRIREEKKLKKIPITKKKTGTHSTPASACPLDDDETIIKGATKVMFESKNPIPLELSDYSSDDELDKSTADILKPWVKSLCLTMSDMDRLIGGKWLTANHVNAAQVLLKEAFPAQNGLNDTHLLMHKKFWPGGSMKFVQVVFVQPGHWVCLSNVMSSSRCEVQLYDSLPTLLVEQTSLKQQACTILKCPESQVVVSVMNCQVQVNGSDCALFAIARAVDLCRGKDPATLLYDESRMRHHLRNCFESKVIVPFPSILISKPKKPTVLSSFRIKVYCVCRQPECAPMVQCDNCQEWWHQSCANIEDDIMALLNDDECSEWFCRNCSGDEFTSVYEAKSDDSHQDDLISVPHSLLICRKKTIEDESALKPTTEAVTQCQNKTHSGITGSDNESALKPVVESAVTQRSTRQTRRERENKTKVSTSNESTLKLTTKAVTQCQNKTGSDNECALKPEVESAVTQRSIRQTRRERENKTKVSSSNESTLKLTTKAVTQCQNKTGSDNECALKPEVESAVTQRSTRQTRRERENKTKVSSSNESTLKLTTKAVTQCQNKTGSDNECALKPVVESAVTQRSTRQTRRERENKTKVSTSNESSLKPTIKAATQCQNKAGVTGSDNECAFKPVVESTTQRSTRQTRRGNKTKVTSSSTERQIETTGGENI